MFEYTSMIRTKGLMTAVAPGIAPITYIDHRMPEVIIASSIMGADGEIPTGMPPMDGSEEIIQRGIEIVLPRKEDATQVHISVTPIAASTVGSPTNTQEVVQIHLISLVILFGGKIQFISHLIGQEPSLTA